MFDPVSRLAVTADSPGTSNAVVTTATTGILIHKVVLEQTVSGSNVVSCLINDDTAIGTTNLMISLSTNSQGGAAGDAYQRYTAETFDPPVPIQRGLSIDVTGTGVRATVYYTRR